MATLTETLDKIGADILHHLSLSKVPLSQWELYERSELGVVKKGAGLSEYGWSFALEKLERKHLIEFVGPKNWKLKDTERQNYINEIESMVKTKVYPD